MKYILTVVCLFTGSLAIAQGYYRNPLDLPMLLSGNFGELRPNHYHMGLDIKTAAVVNKNVYAAADGFVSRIKIEPGGYGRAIYIDHPNGTTTVYAHLNEFYPALEKWVKEQQYLKQSWAIDLEVDPLLFPVKKGTFIARSGNTGGSQAPHLHFEIRNTEEGYNLNPLLYKFPVQDNVAPRILRVALYNRSLSIYEQQPQLVAAKLQSGSNYITTPAVVKVNYPRLSVGFTAFDSHNGSSNQNGIYYAQLLVDDRPDISFLMDSIHYGDTRYLNAHIDYKTRTNRTIYLHQMFQLPGYYPRSIYHTDHGNGLIDLSDGKVHTVKLLIKDAHDNTSKIQFQVQYTGTMLNYAKPEGKLFYPMMIDGFEGDACEFYIGEKCLYESVHIPYKKINVKDSGAISAQHQIGHAYIPLQESFLVRIQPEIFVPEEAKSKVLMLWTSGAKRSASRVTWNGNWASAQFRDFGTFQLVMDTIPPVVKFNFAPGAVLRAQRSVSFNVSDQYGYGAVKAEIDGKWIRFTNDKYKSFIYEFDEHCLPGDHILTVTVTDYAGNTTTETIKFTR